MGSKVKIAIIDDWSNSLSTLSCFSKLDGLDVTIFSTKTSEILTRIDQIVSWKKQSPINMVNSFVWQSAKKDE